MDNPSKLADNYNKNRMAFQSFIREVIDTDKEQEEKEPQPND
jgi:hypothetical protein